MERDLLLRGKFTFRSGDRKMILVKKPVESLRHVVMKAMLWALYLPDYPGLQIEVPVGLKYKPDLVQADETGIHFWAEAGSVSSKKLRRLLKRFPQTHFALAIWGGSLGSLEKRILRGTRGVKRQAPIDIIAFPKDADRRFIGPQGRIQIAHANVDWRQLS